MDSVLSGESKNYVIANVSSIIRNNVFMCICVQRSLSSKLEVVSSYLRFSNEKLSKLFLLGNVLLRRPWLGFFVFVFITISCISSVGCTDSLV